MSDEPDQDDPIVYVEPPRFLAPAARPGDPLGETRDRTGYTSKPYLAMRDEPETIGPAILESYAQINRRIYTQQHLVEVAQAQERRPELTPQNRLDDIYRRAKDGRYDDLKRPVHVIQKELDKARMRGQQPKPGTMQRLEALEALLDGVSVLRMAA